MPISIPAWAVLAVLVGEWAYHKGRSLILWWLFGTLLLPVAGLAVWLVKPRAENLAQRASDPKAARAGHIIQLLVVLGLLALAAYGSQFA